MKAGRPAHVLDAEEAAYLAELFDEDSTLEQRMDAIERYAPPTLAEAVSAARGESLAMLIEHRGLALPAVPAWLHELAGITEVARLVLAALIEMADPVGRVRSPVKALADRLGHRCVITRRPLPALTDALVELRDARLLRGDARAVVLTRRCA